MIRYRDNDTADVRSDNRSWRKQHLLDAAKRMDEKAEYYRKEAEFYRRQAGLIQQKRKEP